MDPQERNNKPDEQKSAAEHISEDHGTQKDAPMAPHQNRPPTEQHRGGPLPYQKR